MPAAIQEFVRMEDGTKTISAVLTLLTRAVRILFEVVHLLHEMGILELFAHPASTSSGFRNPVLALSSSTQAVTAATASCCHPWLEG